MNSQSVSCLILEALYSFTELMLWVFAHLKAAKIANQTIHP
jgi:hypothetical protein